MSSIQQERVKLNKFWTQKEAQIYGCVTFELWQTFLPALSLGHWWESWLKLCRRPHPHSTRWYTTPETSRGRSFTRDTHSTWKWQKRWSQNTYSLWLRTNTSHQNQSYQLGTNKRSLQVKPSAQVLLNFPLHIPIFTKAWVTPNKMEHKQRHHFVS